MEKYYIIGMNNKAEKSFLLFLYFAGKDKDEKTKVIKQGKRICEKNRIK